MGGIYNDKLAGGQIKGSGSGPPIIYFEKYRFTNKNKGRHIRWSLKRLVWWNYCGSSVWPCVPWIWSAECVSSFQVRSPGSLIQSQRHGDLQQSSLLLLQVIDTPHARAGWAIGRTSRPDAVAVSSSTAWTWTTRWKSLLMLSFFNYDLWYCVTWIRPSFLLYIGLFLYSYQGTLKPLSWKKELLLRVCKTWYIMSKHVRRSKVLWRACEKNVGIVSQQSL